MPVRGGGDDIRVHEVRAEQRDPPPGYRRRKEPSSQSFEQGPAYPDEARDFARASEPYTAYKVSWKYHECFLKAIYLISILKHFEDILVKTDVHFKMSIINPRQSYCWFPRLSISKGSEM
jgi:phosphopantetheinyl transferase (holo-ACP synthase)